MLYRAHMIFYKKIVRYGDVSNYADDNILYVLGYIWILVERNMVCIKSFVKLDQEIFCYRKNNLVSFYLTRSNAITASFIHRLKIRSNYTLTLKEHTWEVPEKQNGIKRTRFFLKKLKINILFYYFIMTYFNPFPLLSGISANCRIFRNLKIPRSEHCTMFCNIINSFTNL